jgi:hypothetical protein
MKSRFSAQRFDREGLHCPVIRCLGMVAGSTAPWASFLARLGCTGTAAGLMLRGTGVGLTRSATDTALSCGHLKPNALFVSSRSDGSLGRVAGFAATLAFALVTGIWLRRMHCAERTQMGQAAGTSQVAAL